MGEEARFQAAGFCGGEAGLLERLVRAVPTRLPACIGEGVDVMECAEYWFVESCKVRVEWGIRVGGGDVVWFGSRIGRGKTMRECREGLWNLRSGSRCGYPRCSGLGDVSLYW